MHEHRDDIKKWTKENKSYRVANSNVNKSLIVPKVSTGMDGPGGGFVHHQHVLVLEYDLKLPKHRILTKEDGLSTTNTSSSWNIISSFLNPGFWLHIIKQKIRIQQFHEIWTWFDRLERGFVHHQNDRILENDFKSFLKRGLDPFSQGTDPTI